MTPTGPLPLVAIVGRPNVGKSTLFNRLVGRRVAIVHEESGVTRDRVQARARWGDKVFDVVDTGGIAFFDEEKSANVLAVATRRQAEVAIAMATVIVLVVDVTEGVVPLDREIAARLRAGGKPVCLAVNKSDNPGRERGVAEFSELGFERTFPIAAVHGLGVSELIDAVTTEFSDGGVAEPERPTHIAIVGRPNVGKSSLINCILGSERTIVSEIPGTTRDAVDVPFTWKDGAAVRSYVLVDTAGLRHRHKIKTSVDQFGLMRAERSIRECDLAVLVLDAAAGVTQQDKKIAGQIQEAGRGCVIVVNKWDLAAEQESKGRDFRSAENAPRPAPRSRDQRSTAGSRRTAVNDQKSRKTFREEYLDAVRRQLFFMDWAPVLFLSAKTGERVTDLFGLVAAVERELARRVETPALNNLIGGALDAYPPPFQHGKRLKIFYAFQRPVSPPTFALFVNDARCLTPHYSRFLVDRIRAAYGFSGCPLRLECRNREQRNRAKQ